jgi:hypothetical protein
MTDLVTRLRRTYHAEIQIEPQLVKEAADRIASLKLALVELSQTSVSPSDLANATVLVSGVRTGGAQSTAGIDRRQDQRSV